MLKTTEDKYFKIRTIIQKPRISKIDLTKINSLLANTSLIEEYFIVRLFILSLESGHYQLSNLILSKIEDISNKYIQNEFLTICTQNDIDTIQYLFSNGFVVEDSNYQLIKCLGTQVKPKTIKIIRDFVLKMKIENIRNR